MNVEFNGVSLRRRLVAFIRSFLTFTHLLIQTHRLSQLELIGGDSTKSIVQLAGCLQLQTQNRLADFV